MYWHHKEDLQMAACSLLNTVLISFLNSRTWCTFKCRQRPDLPSPSLGEKCSAVPMGWLDKVSLLSLLNTWGGGRILPPLCVLFITPTFDTSVGLWPTFDKRPVLWLGLILKNRCLFMDQLDPSCSCSGTLLWYYMISHLLQLDFGVFKRLLNTFCDWMKSVWFDDVIQNM